MKLKWVSDWAILSGSDIGITKNRQKINGKRVKIASRSLLRSRSGSLRLSFFHISLFFRVFLSSVFVPTPKRSVAIFRCSGLIFVLLSDFRKIATYAENCDDKTTGVYLNFVNNLGSSPIESNKSRGSFLKAKFYIYFGAVTVSWLGRRFFVASADKKSRWNSFLMTYGLPLWLRRLCIPGNSRRCEAIEKEEKGKRETISAVKNFKQLQKFDGN